ncbi:MULTISPECIES: hypothetical protein [Aneurinibacillus]|uniref:hypothetical protein n=1 Tax=Aneurinibacillus TaxID=55079 RepID=UPI0014783842
MERNFADAKQLQGFRYYRLRGLRNVSKHTLMSVSVQNMKKIALHLSNRGIRERNAFFFENHEERRKEKRK